MALAAPRTSAPRATATATTTVAAPRGAATVAYALAAAAGLTLSAGCGGGSAEQAEATPAAAATAPSSSSPSSSSPSSSAPNSSGLASQPASGSSAVAIDTANDTASSPTGSAPGSIQLPDNFDPAAVPPAGSESSPPASKDGGLTLPPLDGAAAGPTGAAQAAATYHFVSTPAEAAKVNLRAASWDDVKAEIAKSDRLTIVDVWSLACEPCLKEFPGLVKIDRELGKSVRCIAVNTDFDGRRTRPAESYRQRVEAFLQSTQATFPNFLSTTASDEVFDELDIQSIPAVLIYDAQGKLIRKFVDAGADAGFTYEDHIVPFIKQQLDQ